jgi:hypothetical protein
VSQSGDGGQEPRADLWHRGGDSVCHGAGLDRGVCTLFHCVLLKKAMVDE